MSQQENDKKKEEFSNESTNTPENTQDKKESLEEKNGANAEENSFSPNSETEKPSAEKDPVIEPAETASEITPEEHSLEDAMVAEAGDKKKTSEENKASQEDDDEDDALLEESRKQTQEEEKVATETKAKAKIEEKAAEDNSDSDDEEEESSEEEGRTSKHHQEHIDDTVAEDSEDETKAERHDIPKKDYHAMSKEQLVDEFESLLKKEKVQAIKDHVIEIRAEFNAKFNEEEEEKKEEFLADGGNIIDFHYSTPLKKRFNSLYFDYREKRNNYYKQLKQDLNKKQYTVKRVLLARGNC